MKKNKFLIVGSGGRESSFAQQISKDAKLYAVIDHKNTSIIEYVKRSDGEFLIGSSSDPQTVLGFAKKHCIDYAFINSDLPLANGVVDLLLENNIKAVGGTRESTRIEWDKIYSINMMHKVCPQFTPFYKIASNEKELKSAVSEFESRRLELVVKPQGLTGGKGVKVMTEHLPTYDACIEYGVSLFNKNPKEQVLLVEKLDGIEFTIMGITDGTNLVLAPATYDYSYRYEDDKGPGTGSMGCFTDTEKRLPFMTDKDLEDCRYIIQRIIDELRANNLCFNGVINGGFFKTSKGIKFMEFNGRFGDPEGINILSILNGSFSELVISLWEKKLSNENVAFTKKASVTKYLVAKEYPNVGDVVSFTLNEDAIEKLGITIFFAACVKTGEHQYDTLKKSRVAAFACVSDTIQKASDMINKAIDMHVNGDLQYRRDIGSQKSLEKLSSVKF